MPRRLKPTKLWATITPSGEVAHAAKKKCDVMLVRQDHYQLVGGCPTHVGRDRIARVLLTEIRHAS